MRRKFLSLLLVFMMLAGIADMLGSVDFARAGEVPEMAVESISVPDSLKVGNEVTVSAVVYNSGDTELNGLVVTLLEDDQTVDSKNGVSINSKGRETLDFQWTPESEGEYSLTVKVVWVKEIIAEKTVYVSVSPLEAEGLEVEELYPGNGATEVEAGVVPYIVFNKAVDFNFPPGFPSTMKIQVKENGIDGSIYDLVSEEIEGEADKKWVLTEADAETPLNFQAGNEYSLVLNPMVPLTITAQDTGEELASFPEWEFATTGLNGAVPNSIIITEFPRRLTVGETYPLQAIVYDNMGQVIEDAEICWEAQSLGLGEADVDGNDLTGIKPGMVQLIAWAKGYPLVREDRTVYRTEVRSSFDQMVAIEWDVPLDEKYIQVKPLVARDGSIYLSGKQGGILSVSCFNTEGQVKNDCQNITGLSVPPVLAEIAGKEYLIASIERKLIAYDAANGRQVWESEELPAEISTMAAVDAEGQIYVGCSDNGQFYSFSLDYTWPLWSLFTEKVTLGTDAPERDIPVMGPDGRLYFLGKDTLFVVDRQGEEIARFTTPDNKMIRCYPAVDSEGTAYLHTSGCLYAVTSEGVVKWSKTYQNGTFTHSPFLDSEDSMLVFCGFDILRISTDDGSVLEEYPYGSGSFLRDDRGWLYTDKAVYYPGEEPAWEAFAYYDDYYQELPYINYSWGSLCSDGSMVRCLLSGSTVKALQKVYLYDAAVSQPASLEVEADELSLYMGKTGQITVRVRDQHGVVLPNIAVSYLSQDPDIVLVSEGGLVSAQAEGETVIEVSVSGAPEIAPVQVTVKVLAFSEIKQAYFIPHKAGEDVNEDVPLEEISGYVGEELPNVQLYVIDQYDQVIKDLDVTLGLENGDIAGLYAYSGGLMGTSKSVACLNGIKAGLTTLTAELADYPGVTASLDVRVETAPYEILWTFPTEGEWDQKFAYHSQGRDRLFLVNQNKVKAVSMMGDLIWKREIGSAYGIFMEKAPVVDEYNGNVYIYDSALNTFVAALDPDEGETVWTFRKGVGGIVDIQVGLEYLYALNDKGKLYLIDKNGQKLWNQPWQLGNDITGMAAAYGGGVYCSRAHQVLLIGSDRTESVFYEAEGSVLTIKEVTDDGRLLLMKDSNGVFSIVSLGTAGEKEWEFPVEDEMELSCDDMGIVYAVERKMDNYSQPKVYFINPDGSVKSSGIIEREFFSSPYDYSFYYKPVISTEGIVYISIGRVYAIDRETAEVLWRAEIKDGFFKRPPRTVTTDESGVLYIACDDAGFLAVKSLEQAASSDVTLSLLNTPNLRKGSQLDLQVNLRNNREETQDLTVMALLVDKYTGKILSYTAQTGSLEARENVGLHCGIKIPAQGDYLVKVRVLDSEGSLIREKTISVQ